VPVPLILATFKEQNQFNQLFKSNRVSSLYPSKEINQVRNRSGLQKNKKNFH